MTNGEAKPAQGDRIRPASVAGAAAARASPLALRYARPLVVVLLLLIVIAGVRAGGPVAGGRGPWRQDAPAIGIGLELALGWLQIGLAIRARRWRQASHLATVLRSAVRRVAAAAMIAIALVALADVAGLGNESRALRVVTGQPVPTKVPKLRNQPGFGAVFFSFILFTVLVMLVMTACVLLLIRLRRRWPRGHAGGPRYDEPADDQASGLVQAVESGRTALRTLDDARAAIIACYLAMEGSLATAGTARAVAETPDELLGRAAAAGLIHGPAAAMLTGLFYEARFSSHPLPATARDDARRALEAISAELRGTTAAAGPEPGQAGAPQPTQAAGQARQ